VAPVHLHVIAAAHDDAATEESERPHHAVARKVVNSLRKVLRLFNLLRILI